jgi:hypothetical protein
VKRACELLTSRITCLGKSIIFPGFRLCGIEMSPAAAEGPIGYGSTSFSTYPFRHDRRIRGVQYFRPPTLTIFKYKVLRRTFRQGVVVPVQRGLDIKTTLRKRPNRYYNINHGRFTYSSCRYHRSWNCRLISCDRSSSCWMAMRDL